MEISVTQMRRSSKFPDKLNQGSLVVLNRMGLAFNPLSEKYSWKLGIVLDWKIQSLYRELYYSYDILTDTGIIREYHEGEICEF